MNWATFGGWCNFLKIRWKNTLFFRLVYCGCSIRVWIGVSAIFCIVICDLGSFAGNDPPPLLAIRWFYPFFFFPEGGGGSTAVLYVNLLLPKVVYEELRQSFSEHISCQLGGTFACALKAPKMHRIWTAQSRQFAAAFISSTGTHLPYPKTWSSHFNLVLPYFRCSRSKYEV